MLYFVTKSGRDIGWVLGDSVPALDDVAEVQADCSELEYIRGNFGIVIPSGVGSRVVWRGDSAVFIHAGLRILCEMDGIPIWEQA